MVISKIQHKGLQMIYFHKTQRVAKEAPLVQKCFNLRVLECAQTALDTSPEVINLIGYW